MLAVDDLSSVVPVFTLDYAPNDSRRKSSHDTSRSKPLEHRNTPYVFILLKCSEREIWAFLCNCLPIKSVLLYFYDMNIASLPATRLTTIAASHQDDTERLEARQ